MAQRSVHQQQAARTKSAAQMLNRTSLLSAGLPACSFLCRRPSKCSAGACISGHINCSLTVAACCQLELESTAATPPCASSEFKCCSSLPACQGATAVNGSTPRSTCFALSALSCYICDICCHARCHGCRARLGALELAAMSMKVRALCPLTPLCAACSSLGSGAQYSEGGCRRKGLSAERLPLCAPLLLLA